MRREGCKFAYRTNHTLRTNSCSQAAKHSGFGSCDYHARALTEWAYSSLRAKTGQTHFQTEELQKEAATQSKVTGCRKTRLGGCFFGSAARKATATCSCCSRERSTKHEIKEDIVKEMKDDMHLCLL